MKSKDIMPDVVTYNTLLNGYNLVKKIEEAEKYFVEMKARNIEPNVISYTTMIKGYSSVERFDDALRLFEEMKGFGIKPNPITYSTLLRGLCDANKMSEARMILKEMEERYKDNSVFMRLISGLCETGDLDAAADVMKTMNMLSVPIEAGHYGVLIESFCKAGIYDRAVKFLDELIEKEIILQQQLQKTTSRLPMERSAYNLVIDYLCKNGQTGKAETLFNQLLKTGVQDPVAFNNIVCGHSREGSPDSALELLKIMERRRVPTDDIAHKSLVDYYLMKGKPDDAKAALDNMYKHGHYGESYHSLYISVMLKIMLEEAREEEIMQEYGFICEDLLRIDLDLQFGFSPDLDGLLYDLCEKGKTYAAVKLLYFGLERNCNIDIDKVVDTFVAAGKTRIAYSILCKMIEKGVVVKDYKISCEEELIKRLNDEGNTKLADILRRIILELDGKKMITAIAN